LALWGFLVSLKNLSKYKESLFQFHGYILVWITLFMEDVLPFSRFLGLEWTLRILHLLSCSSLTSKGLFLMLER
jgi:hypothetical protein